MCSLQQKCSKAFKLNFVLIKFRCWTSSWGKSSADVNWKTFRRICSNTENRWVRSSSNWSTQRGVESSSREFQTQSIGWFVVCTLEASLPRFVSGSNTRHRSECSNAIELFDQTLPETLIQHRLKRSLWHLQPRSENSCKIENCQRTIILRWSLVHETDKIKEGKLIFPSFVCT